MRKLWPTWHIWARCRGEINDAIFFGAPKDGTFQTSAIRAAKKYCNDCPVFEDCLRYALEGREKWGIWAGTTMKERESIFVGLDNGLFSMEEIVQDRLEVRADERRQGSSEL